VFKKIAKLLLLFVNHHMAKQDVINFLNVPEERVRIIQAPHMALNHRISMKNMLGAVKERYGPDRFLFYRTVLGS
jgi:hypothetical protein